MMLAVTVIWDQAEVMQMREKARKVESGPRLGPGRRWLGSLHSVIQTAPNDPNYLLVAIHTRILQQYVVNHYS